MTPAAALAFLIEYHRKHHCRHVYLVTGRTSFKLSGAEKTLKPYFEGIQTLTHFDGVPKNPHVESVETAAQLVNTSRPDLIIAIGGGSAMDLAKALALRLSSGRSAAECLNPEVAKSTLALPLIAIPTTTGTGSEVTRFAVIYQGKTKHSISSPSLLPRHALLVPEFTLAQPAAVRKAAAFDALTQACESYWARSANEDSKTHAMEAIKLLTPRLKNGLEHFSLADAEDVQLGAHLAGKAIDCTRTTAPHALSYALTMDYGVDHGHAVGVLFPKVWRLHLDLARRGCLPDALHKRMALLTQMLGLEGIETLPTFWEGLLHSNHLPFKFNDLGLTSSEDWSLLCKRVNLERLANHPCTLTSSDLERLWTLEISAD